MKTKTLSGAIYILALMVVILAYYVAFLLCYLPLKAFGKNPKDYFEVI